MSDFCTRCHKAHKMPGEPAINVQQIFDKKLTEDNTMVGGFICEGCTLIAVARIQNKLQVQYLDGDWTDYTRLPKGKVQDE